MKGTIPGEIPATLLRPYHPFRSFAACPEQHIDRPQTATDWRPSCLVGAAAPYPAGGHDAPVAGEALARWRPSFLIFLLRLGSDCCDRAFCAIDSIFSGF